MSNPYKEKIGEFLEDEILLNAVKNILEVQFDLNIEMKNEMSNAQIAEIVRGCLDGKKRLEKGFKELEKFKKSKSEEKEMLNPAV